MSVAVEVSPWTLAPFALDGETVFAVGDVHGCADHLQSLLDAARTLAAESTGPRRLVYLGDMIDRGPDTLGVLRLWAEGPQSHGFDRIDRIIGNHEILMLLTLRGGPLAGRANAMWQSERMGGAKVVDEMRAVVHDLAAPPSYELARTALGQQTLDLLLTQRSHLRLGNTLFVHGGLAGGSDPTRSWSVRGRRASTRAGPGSRAASSTGRAASKAHWSCMATRRPPSTANSAAWMTRMSWRTTGSASTAAVRSPVWWSRRRSATAATGS